jgi:transposase
VPYLTLMREDAQQRQHSLRELFNGLQYVIRYGIAWRAIPRTICRLGRRSISRNSGGWPRHYVLFYLSVLG